MTIFSIISFFDPYGDMKSDRKRLSKTNYTSEKSLAEIKALIDVYNNGAYYNGVELGSFDGRNRKEVQNFDTSYYLTSTAQPARYESIPGY